MHVLILPSEEFVPVKSPPAGIFQYHQAKILNEAGYDIGVISISLSFSIPMIAKAILLKGMGKNAGNTADQYSVKELLALGFKKVFRPQTFITVENKEGIPVYRMDGLYLIPPSDKYDYKSWLAAGKQAFKRYVAEKGMPDLIHVHNALHAGMLAEEIATEYKVPYILTEHSTAFARGEITRKSVLDRIKKVYDKSTALYAVSEKFCELLNEQFGIKRFKYLPNVLDPFLENRVNVTACKEIKQKEFIFANIAELHPKKDHKLLIRAFKQIHNKYPMARLQLGGNGELEEELKGLVVKEGLGDVVIFLGQINRQQVYECLTKCDCLVLSSKFETFGVVVIEAMLFGKPVIVTRCGGPETFVNEQTGIIVEKENEQQLVAAMEDMINNSSRYDASYITKYVKEKFGKETFIARMNKIYKEAV